MGKYIPAMADHWLNIVLIFLFVLNSQVHGFPTVHITYLDSAVQKGAVCLDGSPPAYDFAKGSGSGANNWIVYLEGGGWCALDFICAQRAKMWLGSSYKKNKTANFRGLLNEDPTYNPDFYNWNRVVIRYCDGSSFMSDSETIDSKTNLTFRGGRIFNAVIEELLAEGMENADNAILAGSSAGGLATILHCDIFRAFLPNANRVKCLADSGVFIHAKHLPGLDKRERPFTHIVKLHGLANLLPKSCTSRMNSTLCLFPEYYLQDIQTPLFLFDSTFDSWKIENHLDPIPRGQPNDWIPCANQSKPCSSAQLQLMKDYAAEFIETLKKIGNSSTRGMFIHSCYIHALATTDRVWSRSPVLKGKTVAQAFSDWYFDRSPFQEIDTRMDDPQRNCTVPA